MSLGLYTVSLNTHFTKDSSLDFVFYIYKKKICLSFLLSHTVQFSSAQDSSDWFDMV